MSRMVYRSDGSTFLGEADGKQYSESRASYTVGGPVGDLHMRCQLGYYYRLNAACFCHHQQPYFGLDIQPLRRLKVNREHSWVPGDGPFSMLVRDLELLDFDKGILSLLAQLTVVGDVSRESFAGLSALIVAHPWSALLVHQLMHHISFAVERFEELRKSPDYKTVVVEGAINFPPFHMKS